MHEENLRRHSGGPGLDVFLDASGHHKGTSEASMSKRILVVEDQVDNRQIVRDLLTANDYEMTEAENGEEALAALEKERPDLIVLLAKYRMSAAGGSRQMAVRD